MKTCGKCKFFKLDNGAYYVGDCITDINKITTLNSKAENCAFYEEKKGEEENGSGSESEEN